MSNEQTYHETVEGWLERSRQRLDAARREEQGWVVITRWSIAIYGALSLCGLIAALATGTVFGWAFFGGGLMGVVLTWRDRGAFAHRRHMAELDVELQEARLKGAKIMEQTEVLIKRAKSRSIPVYNRHPHAKPYSDDHEPVIESVKFDMQDSGSHYNEDKLAEKLKDRHPYGEEE